MSMAWAFWAMCVGYPPYCGREGLFGVGIYDTLASVET